MRQTKVGRYSKIGLEVANLYEFFCRTHIKHCSNDHYYNKKFELEAWQRKYIWRPIFASGKIVRGKFQRRYRRALIGLPRDYGKSELACAMLMTVANMEIIYNGQYGLIASSEDQASNLLTKLKTMIALNPDLHQWKVLKKSIVNTETNAEIKVYPYKEAAVQSWHFNVVIGDELHVWKDKQVWNAIISGQKSIPGALAIGITTAGAEQKGFLYDWLQKDIEHDPSCYLFWLGASENEKHNLKTTWKKLCLPSWITLDDIKDQYHALDRGDFERYVLNRFPAKKDLIMAIKTSSINKCKKIGGEFDFDSFFTVGIDGAVSGDTLAICCYQEQDGKNIFKEYAWTEPDESGYYDFTEVMDVITMLSRQHGRPQIGLDPARMVLLMKMLEKERGVKTFVLKQQPSIMCPASAMLKHAIESEKATLVDCPLLADHAGNCIKEESKAYGFRFTSQGSGKTKHRIDMAIAAAMAMYIYKNTEPKTDYTKKKFVFEL